MFLRFPFNSDRKRFTTGINYRNKKALFLTGGSEMVLSVCEKMYSTAAHAKGIVPIDRRAVDEELASLTKRGLRVVALAVKNL
jgi:magnesium-transporting ATPase (P-type)